MASSSKRGLWIALGGLVAVVVVVGLGAYSFLQRNVPQTYADPVEHFKYGSIGADSQDGGVPYVLWRVLPTVFADKLPNRPGEGYARFGFVYESPASARPIGTSIREQPVALLGLNCAACHTGTVRDAAGDSPRFVLGMPAQQLDAQAYLRFLFATGQDPRFNPDTLLLAVRVDNPSFSWIEDLFYRYVIIPRTRDALIARGQAFSWMNTRPDFLPGRVDTFNPYVQRLQERLGPASGFDIAKNNTIGTADLPSLWNQRPREGMWLHWDGNNNSVDERNKSATLGAGATENSLDDASLARIHDWIADLPPPLYPANKINTERAQAGEKMWLQHCAHCHAFGAPQVGQVTHIAEIGTDRSRLDSFTPELAKGMTDFGKGFRWQFSHFRKTDGYANMPLDGLWLRAPYLHNGSVPTLRDLLKPPDQRPKVFYRGNDEYDYDNVGFVSSGPDAERKGARFDTSVAGNSNSGHVYGTNLTRTEQDVLLEYLKTL